MNICQNLSFQSLVSKVLLLSKVPKQCFVFGHFGLFSSTKLKNDWTNRLQKLPRKINILLTLTKKNWLKKKMNGSCLINQVRPYMLQDTLQIAEKAFFSDTLFRAWFYDNQFSKIKFCCFENIGDVPIAYPWWSAILLKLQLFIPQFN